METYNAFLKYYDEIVRGINSPLDEEVQFLTDLIIKYNNKRFSEISILETACGTGVVAKEFIKKGFLLTGLDISQNMLDIAKINIGESNVVLGDMTNFDLQKKYDVVLCNYNSICHLLDWSDWQKFIQMAYNHLNNNGLFIFDINTLYEFENITRDFSQFYTFNEDVVCLEMLKKEGIYKWIVKMFIKNQDGRYDLKTEVVKENSFSIPQIKKELKQKGFKLLELLDFHYGDVNPESERVYFVCGKE